MDNEDLREEFSAAVSQVLATRDEMVTKWVACVESIDGDGQRALWVMAEQDIKPWDLLGLLTFALQQQQSAAIASDLEGDG